MFSKIKNRMHLDSSKHSDTRLPLQTAVIGGQLAHIKVFNSNNLFRYLFIVSKM